LAALGEHVYSLDAKATQLSDQYPDQSEAIQAKQSQINQAWNDLIAKVRYASLTELFILKVKRVVYIFRKVYKQTSNVQNISAAQPSPLTI